MRVDTKHFSSAARWGKSECEHPKGAPGWIEITEKQLTTSAGETFTLDALDGGWIIPEKTPVVVLRTSNRFVSFTVAKKSEAQRVLQAAGWAPKQRSLHFLVGFPLSYGIAMTSAALLLAYVPVAIFDPNARSPLVIAAMVLSFVVTIVLLWMVQREITLGRDGIHWRKGGTKVFVPLDSIANVEATDFHFRIHRRKSPPLVLWEWTPSDTSEQAEQAQARWRKRFSNVLKERIESLRAAADDFDPHNARFAALDRNGRDVAAWKQALQTVCRPDENYRQGAPITKDELVQLIGHTDTTAERRAAATVALVGLAPDEASGLAMQAIEALADPAVEATVRAALEGELTTDQVKKSNK